jgi:hypothetical protein
MDSPHSLVASIAIAPPPPGTVVGAGYFKEISTVLSWPIRLREGMTLESSISAFNQFNFSNFGIPTPLMSTQTNGPFTAGEFGSSGSVTGTTTGANRESLRTGTGSGVLSNGAPRQVEFGLRFTF